MDEIGAVRLRRGLAHFRQGDLSAGQNRQKSIFERSFRARDGYVVEFLPAVGLSRGRARAPDRQGSKTALAARQTRAGVRRRNRERSEEETAETDSHCYI